MGPSLSINGIGLLTPLGDSLPMVRAAIAAGLSAYRLRPFTHGSSTPLDIKAAPLPDALRPDPSHGRAAGALQWLQQAGAAAGGLAGVPLLIAVEPALNLPRAEIEQGLMGLPRPPLSLQWLPGGRAGLPGLLQGAAEALAAGAFEVVIAALHPGLDEPYLQRLADAKRLLQIGAGGLAPGEACVCIKLGPGTGALTCLGHAMVPASPEAQPESLLSEALRAALESAGQPPIDAIYATTTGERAAARALGTALLRAPGELHHHSVEQPAQSLGDLGAAAPLLHLLLAAERHGTTLLLGQSDDGSASALILRGQTA